MKKLTLDDLIGKSENEKMTIIYMSFFDYSKVIAKYCRYSEGETTPEYIASGFINKFYDLIEKTEKTDNDYFDTFIHTIALVKKVKRNLNFTNIENSEVFKMYTNCEVVETINENAIDNKKINSIHLVNEIDIFNQWLNRDNRTAQKKNRYFDDDKTFCNSIKSNYGNPYSELLKKTAVENAIHFVKSIKQSDIEKMKAIKNVKVKSNKDKQTIKNFKKRYYISEVNYNDIMYLLEAYL